MRQPQVLVQVQKVEDTSPAKGGMDIVVSLALAQRDHNFPTTDLANFANSDDEREEAKPPTRQHLSILQLLNPPDDFPAFEGTDSEDEGMDVARVGDEEDIPMETDDNLDQPADLKLPKSTRVNIASLSDSEDEQTDFESVRPSKRLRGDGPIKTVAPSLTKKTASRKDEVIIDKAGLNAWRKAILVKDPYATFDPANLRRVRHSGCGKFLQVKEPLDLSRWRSHLKQCAEHPKTSKSAGTPSVFTMKGWAQVPKTTPMQDLDNRNYPPAQTPIVLPQPSKLADAVTTSTRPCPGITDLDCPDISRYLMRSAANGGGGRSIHVVAKEMFRKAFSSLRSSSKDEVLAAQLHSHTWRNDHQHLRIYSTVCKKVVASRTPQRPLPCDECVSVMRSKTFKTTMRKKTPLPKNQIYTNKKYQNPVVGEIYSRHIGLKEIIESQVRLVISSIKTCLIINYVYRIQKQHHVFVTRSVFFVENTTTKYSVGWSKPSSRRLIA